MDQLQVQSIPTKQNGFRWIKSDAFLFDIDGTLLSSRDRVHYNALNRAMLQAYGVDTTIAGVAYHGKTDLGILRAALARVGVSTQAFEANLPTALAAVCRDVSDNAAAITPHVFDGVPQLLATLKSEGKLLGLASGNLEEVGWRKVQAAGLADYFSFGCFSDQHEHRADIFRSAVAETKRRLGNDATICFIGDTPEDIKAARLANAHVIAVCTGIFKSDELLPLQPDLCVACCTELSI
ncbi:MAG TPA: HAD family hydrolase [Terriglobales bacterium]|nr:HAD family hydrolase [Terriglobales bacterium]